MTVALAVIGGLTDLQQTFLLDVLERNEITEAQVVARFPKWVENDGWRILDKLLSEERETQLHSMQSRPASKRQVSLVEAYRVVAVAENNTRLVTQIDNLLTNFSASMADFSVALDVLVRNLVLPEKKAADESVAAADELAASLNNAWTDGQEEPF